MISQEEFDKAIAIIQTALANNLVINDRILRPTEVTSIRITPQKAYSSKYYGLDTDKEQGYYDEVHASLKIRSIENFLKQELEVATTKAKVAEEGIVQAKKVHREAQAKVDDIKRRLLQEE